MKIKKMILAAVGCFVVSFLIAAIWHLALFKNLYHELGIFSRKEPLVHLGIIDNVLKAFVLAYVYPIGYQGGSSVREGLRFGILMAILVGSSWILGMAATQPAVSISTWLFLETPFVLLQFGLAGMVIGLIYGKNSSSKRVK
jgi:hypothetical protein